MKKTKILNSFRLKSLYYLIVFALSVILLFEFFQLVLFEPFYKNTIKNELKNLNDDVATIYFDDDYKEKEQSIKALTLNSSACILIFNTDDQHVIGYDSLSDNQCVIYADSNVNQEYIDKMKQTSDSELIIENTYSELNQETLVYGAKYDNNGIEYYILSNSPIQQFKTMVNALQSQLIVITIIVILLSILIAFIISSMITKPITKITNEAEKLQYGNYDLNFESSDINEVQKLAETVDLAAKEISKVDDYRKELIANVSHDIKTPITMIKAYAEMIKDISGDDKQKRGEHLDIIISETDLLSRLVNDMLDLSKLQEGVLQINVKPFDLSQMINDVVNKFNIILKDKQEHIDISCEPELVVLGDEARLNEVLYNFITNALKHVGNDLTINVNAYHLTKHIVRVEVSDHGEGIDEDVLPYIWDRYFKIDKQYQRSQTGTGLGLAINKAILERHESNYGCNSIKNEGSTFFFDLKLADTLWEE